MAKKSKNDIDEDFIRQIREASKPKCYTTSTILQESSSRSDDKVEPSGDIAEQVAKVATATNADIVTEESLPSTCQQTETIEVAKVAKATDAANVTNAIKVEEETADGNYPKEDVRQPKIPQPMAEPTVPTPKGTRISAKMRKATRAEFCEAYTGKVDTKGGKPITITSSALERLYRLCSLSGNRNACPTYVVNNLLSEFLDAVEPDAKKWGLLD